MTLSSNWPRHPTFYRVIAGSNPARVATFPTTNMNPNQQTLRDKKLLAIHRERRALWKRQRQTIEINPPIPRGWVRHWRLTSKARNRHDVSILKTILLAIDNHRFHWRKSFESGRRRRRRMVENSQNLSGIREHRWTQLGWPEEWKKYFRKIVVNIGRPDQTFAYKILREDLFELFTERHYIRRVRVIDPELESREAELNQYLNATGLVHRLDRMLDCVWKRGPDPRQRKLTHIAKRRIHKAYQGDWEAEARRHHLFAPASRCAQYHDFYTLM